MHRAVQGRRGVDREVQISGHRFSPHQCEHFGVNTGGGEGVWARAGSDLHGAGSLHPSVRFLISGAKVF